MMRWRTFGYVLTASSLLLVLPLLSTGHRNQDIDQSGTTIANAAPGPVATPAPPAAPAAPNPAAPVPGAQLGPAVAPADDPYDMETVIPFEKVRFASPPRFAAIKQPGPNGAVIHYVVFRYRVQGDPDSILDFVNEPSASSPAQGGTWLVRLPWRCKAGTKTRGEWENLFLTYMVPDIVALKKSQRALQARLNALRKKVYGRATYAIDVAAGDKLPDRARLQSQDAAASINKDPMQRAQTYMRMTEEALMKGRRSEAKIYLSAAASSLADLAVHNKKYSEALWMYQNIPRQVR